MSVDADIFVVGAGPAGLTAAYCLTRETPSVIVVEKDLVCVGGLARTIKHKDFLFDIGGQRLFSKAAEVLALWQEILPDGFVTRPQLSRILHRGKYYAHPLTAREALKRAGVLAGVTNAMSYALARATPIQNPRSCHDWMRNQFGEKLFRTFFKAYTEKLLGMSSDEISADWATHRVRDSARSRIGHPSGKNNAGAAIDTFLYPRKGPGMMWEAAASQIRERGARLLMGRELRRLSYDSAAKIWRIEVTAPATVETFTARHVISSAPVRNLMDCLAERPISMLQARALRYRDMIVVALMTRNAPLTPEHAIHVHDPAVKVSRVQNFRSLSEEMTPEGMGCLGLEYFCFEGDDTWTATDEELTAMARKEIVQIGLLAADDIVDACVVRQPKACPIYDEDYHHNMAMIRLDLETHYPTLHLVGRNGMHKHNNQDHAVMTAMLTARNILAGERIHDVWNVNEDAEYPEAENSGFGEALTSEPATQHKLAGEVAA